MCSATGSERASVVTAMLLELALLPADRFTPSAWTTGLLLQELRAWGGTRGWRLQHGADPENIDLLRVRLTGDRMSVRRAG